MGIRQRKVSASFVGPAQLDRFDTRESAIRRAKEYRRRSQIPWYRRICGIPEEKPKVTKDMIGIPTQFKHTGHIGIYFKLIVMFNRFQAFLIYRVMI